jgi:hypothetical protein
MRIFMVKFEIAAILLLLACNGSDVTQPADVNDYDAIYHIISIDKISEFNLDLLDFSVPDTLPPELAQLQIEHYWFSLLHDSLDLIIDIEYPDFQDTLGSIPEADVREIKIFTGTLEIIGIDTAGGGQVPVRFSTEFIIRGEITARFAKFGSDLNFRRGWLLTHISDVSYTSFYPQGITQISINSASYPDLILTTGIKAMDDVLVFAPGETVTVTVNGSNLDDLFRIRYPQGGAFHTILIEPDFNNNLIMEIQMPETEQFNHFLVEAIGETSFGEQGPFRYEAFGLLYKIEE